MMNRNDAQPFTREPGMPSLTEVLITFVGAGLVIGAIIMTLLIKGV